MHAAMTEFFDSRPVGPRPDQEQPPKRARSSAEAEATMCLPCGASPVSAAAAVAASSATARQSEDDDEEEDQLEGSVFYIHSDRLLKAAAKHPQHPMRTLLVHSLIKACGLLPHLEVDQECEVDRIDLTKFHSRSYVDFLRKPNAAEEEEYGCDYDCPCFPQMWEYARAVVGGTLAGARKLIDGEARIAMHFNGGRHHAKPDRADGFCYVNDICIAIFELLVLGPVLYIDIDCHHGDGVEQAFYSSNRVRECPPAHVRTRWHARWPDQLTRCLHVRARSHVRLDCLCAVTLSLHRYGPGYFPGSGKLDATGTGNGVGYACNVPLKAGIADERYLELFRPIADAARRCENAPFFSVFLPRQARDKRNSTEN